MRNFSRVVSGAVAATVLAIGASVAIPEMPGTAMEPMKENAEKAADHGILMPDDLQWKAGPESLPAGAQMVVLEGNPMEDGPFTIRLKVADAYRIAPHSHPGIEHVTVISGTVRFGMGDKFDEKDMKELPAGSFVYMKPGMTHFVLTKGETIVQLHGIGPWGIKYVNDADDPRKNKTVNEGQ